MIASMILSAGLGTRLRPLTDERAKPMVPVGDGPAIGHVLAQVRLAADRVVVNVHHLPEDLQAWARERGVEVSIEPRLRGTAGGVAQASALLGDGDVLVWNGDVVSRFDPRPLVERHGAGVATLAIAPRARGEGNVGVSADGRVVRLRTASFGDEARGGDFLGVHVVSAALRGALPGEGCLVGDVYIPALARGERLDALDVTAGFVDVGSVAGYLEANASWLAERGLASFAAEGATVSASIDGSVVGAGARVDAPAIGCVIWPGAHVTEPVTRCVVTPRSIARP